MYNNLSNIFDFDITKFHVYLLNQALMV